MNDPKRKSRKGKKKSCPRGHKCAYQEEYQHSLEFFHEDSSVSKGPAKKKTKETGRSISGSGVKLRSVSNGPAKKKVIETSRSTFGSVVNSRDSSIILVESDQEEVAIDLISPDNRSTKKGKVVNLCDYDTDDDEVEAIKSKPSKRRTRRHQDNLDSYSSTQSFPGIYKTSPDHEESIILQERKQLSKAIAESNREIVKDQDNEYQESLRKDIEKERMKEDESDMKAALHQSQTLYQTELRTNQQAKIDAYRNTLEPEPKETVRDVVTIAFRLPTKCQKSRIVRRFLRDSHVQHMFAFLHCSKELDQVKNWTLQDVVGRNAILEDSGKSLQDLGLSPNGLVIVKDEDT